MSTHKFPYTDEERIEAGQQHYEFHDTSGNLIFECWRPNRNCARHAYVTAMRSLKRQKADHERKRRHMANLLERREREVKRMKYSKGEITINDLTFFDL